LFKAESLALRRCGAASVYGYNSGDALLYDILNTLFKYDMHAFEGTTDIRQCRTPDLDVLRGVAWLGRPY
jgi:hypothetical protein